MLGNVLLIFLVDLHLKLVKVEGGGYFSGGAERSLSSHLALTES